MNKAIFILGIIVSINYGLPQVLCQLDVFPIVSEADGSEQIYSDEMMNDVEANNEWINIFGVPSTIAKRDPGPTFWPTHPSDYTPMRRPSGKPLSRKTVNNKKSGGPTDPENPYHPVPRAVKQHQKNVAKSESEEWQNNRLQKRQSPGSYLILKLSRKPKETNSRKVQRRS